jgi:hypothetical protein
MERLRARSLSLSALALGIAVASCSDGPPPVEHEPERASTQQPLIGGVASTPEQNAVVQLFKDGAPECTGVLVHPRLALTARHCLVTLKFDVDALKGRCTVGTDVAAPETLTVAFGENKLSFKQYGVKRVISDLLTQDCTDDFAIIELAEDVPVVGFTLPPIRLDSLLTQGASVQVIGWGAQADDKFSTDGTRHQQPGTTIAPNGGTFKVQDTAFDLPPGYLVTSQHPCSGDSGSPVLDDKGAVAGILTIALPPGEQLICSQAAAVSVQMTRHVSLVERAFQSLGRMPTRAGKPPPAELGGTCAANNECHSNLCVGLGPNHICSKTCKPETATTDCPQPLVCGDTGRGYSVCMDQPAKAEKHGCNTSPTALTQPSHDGTTSPFWFTGIIGAMALGRARRAKQSRARGDRRR